MNMNLQWWDWVGLAGTASVLLGFFLLQAGRLHGQRIVFQLLNLFGAIGLLVSLYGKFNVSVVFDGRGLAPSAPTASCAGFAERNLL